MNNAAVIIVAVVFSFNDELVRGQREEPDMRIAVFGTATFRCGND